MNIAVSPADGLPVPPPAPIAEADEPIILLIENYLAGIRAYDVLPDDVVNDSDRSHAAINATYGVHLKVLQERTPVIRTASGAIAALRFAAVEAELFADGHNVTGVIKRVLEFIESTAGAALIEHPDAELLRLDVDIAELTSKIEANCAFHNALVPECNRQYFDSPEALIVGANDRDWFGTQITTCLGNTRWCPDDAAAVKAPRRVFVGTLAAATERAAELRRAGAAHKARYAAWEESVGLGANEEEYCALIQQRDVLYQQALVIHPRTLAGVGVQAKIVRRENIPLFNLKPDEYDSGEKETVAFINNLLPVEG